MADTDIRSTTISDTTNYSFSEDANGESYFGVDAKSLDSPADQEETTYINSKWTQYHGYYRTIPELKQAVDALASWTCGKGWKADNRTSVILNKIKGWGEDTFQSIMENMMVIKKVNGDAFAEIIRNENGTLINIKPLSPASIKIVANRKGIIKRYEQIDKFSKKKPIKFEPTEIFHISNNRIGDEIHGVSVVESCEEIILARNEAIHDWRQVLHRNINPLKVIEVDEDDPTKINSLITQYQKMYKDYEALFVPKGNLEVTIPAVPLQNPIEWIRYLENFFYQAVGVPRVILGGTNEMTEASSKVGYLVFEQVYMREQRELEGDLFNQLGIQVSFERPVSIKDNMQNDEAANTGQVGFQPKETNINMERE